MHELPSGLYLCNADQSVTDQNINGPVVYIGRTWRVPRDLSHTYQLEDYVPTTEELQKEFSDYERVPDGKIELIALCDQDDPSYVIMAIRIPYRPKWRLEDL